MQQQARVSFLSSIQLQKSLEFLRSIQMNNEQRL